MRSSWIFRLHATDNDDARERVGEERGGEREGGAWFKEEERWVDRLSLLIRLSASTTTTRTRTRTTTTLSSASSQKSAMSVESVFISFPLTLSLSVSLSLSLYFCLSDIVSYGVGLPGPMESYWKPVNVNLLLACLTDKIYILRRRWHSSIAFASINQTRRGIIKAYDMTIYKHINPKRELTHCFH